MTCRGQHGGYRSSLALVAYPPRLPRLDPETIQEPPHVLPSMPGKL